MYVYRINISLFFVHNTVSLPPVISLLFFNLVLNVPNSHSIYTEKHLKYVPKKYYNRYTIEYSDVQ